MKDKDMYCTCCNKITSHMSLGSDIPEDKRYKCKECGVYNKKGYSGCGPISKGAMFDLVLFL